jgi:voltage-gated potassium channel
VILAAVRRGKEVIAPRGDVALQEGDTVILGAEPLRDDQHIDFQEVTLRRQHPWNGKPIRELDISRHTLIVTVRRGNKALIPNGDLVLKEGDTITLYTQIPLSDAEKVRV